MTKGNIIKWYVKPGDEVKSGTVLADIETDKATLAFENQEDGFLAQLLIPEGSRDIEVGAPVAIICEESASIPSFANYATSAAAAAEASSAPGAPAPSTTNYPPHTPMTMPALSPTMERGNIISWKVKEGDVLKPGDVLAEIETDKATLAFENQEEGVMAKILMPAGSKDVTVGSIVAIVVDDPASVPAFASYTGVPAPTAAATTSTAAAAPAPAAPAPGPKVQANFRLGPAARHLMDEVGLTSEDITPTGPNNIITLYDVQDAIKAGVKHGQAHGQAAAPATTPSPAAAAAARPVPAAPAPAAASASYVDIPNSQVRGIIAQRLLASKLENPCHYVAVEAEVNALNKLRADWAAMGQKVSVNDLIMRAVALALKDVPEANSYWSVKQQRIEPCPSVDVSFAVATPTGLITPIVRNAPNKTMSAMSTEIKELAARARDNKLKPEEFQGGTFTVSNLGMYNLKSFSAIINPPQAAILAVGGLQQKVVLVKGQPQTRQTISLTISADQRVYDAQVIGRFTTALMKYVETPSLMLM